MLDNIFSSSFINETITTRRFLVSTTAALICGLIIAFLYMVKAKYSKSFVITLTLMPTIVGTVIMLVNGSVGAGVAVAGAFSLVKFRSAPGRAQEITSIFLAMAVGIATGMGFIGIAIIFTIVVAMLNLILNVIDFGGKDSEIRLLKITVPENLDFEGKFEDILNTYLESYEIDEVRTSNMGSLYKLTISVVLKSTTSVKVLLDEIRTRNGNLEVALMRNETRVDEL